VNVERCRNFRCAKQCEQGKSVRQTNIIVNTSTVQRAALFAVFWWLLTDGAPTSWFIGLPTVIFAAVISTALIPPSTFVWHELVRFVPFFLVRSLSGGFDVAWRALHPRLPIAPVVFEYTLRISPGLPRVFVANTVNLLPGTLSADLTRERLKVHVLDRRHDFRAEVAAVEQRVARLFGERLINRVGEP